MGGLGAKVRFDTVQRREIFDRTGPPLTGALKNLPGFDGPPIQLEWRRGLRVRRGQLSNRGQEVHAAAFLRRRKLVLDAALRRDACELRRIVVHELFHFAWIRLSNAVRRDWEHVLKQELSTGTKGELGWSAAWRKLALSQRDVNARTRRWREYACESFCDTAAFLFSASRHPEFTLRAALRERRARWFQPLLHNRVKI